MEKDTHEQMFFYCRDLASPNVEYLGVMAWAAQFQWIPDRTAPGDRLEIFCSTSKAKVGEEVRDHFHQFY
jgi:filamin